SWLFRRWNSCSKSPLLIGSESGGLDWSGATLQRIELRRTGQASCRIGLAPERIFKDADRAASGSDVLNLAAREPVIDRPPAHADNLACAGNRQGLAVGHHRAIAPTKTIGVRFA